MSKNSCTFAAQNCKENNIKFFVLKQAVKSTTIKTKL